MRLLCSPCTGSVYRGNGNLFMRRSGHLLNHSCSGKYLFTLYVGVTGMSDGDMRCVFMLRVSCNPHTL